jgi:hypothetical protein
MWNVRRPLRKYAGMEFVDVKISLYKFSFNLTKIEILPVESPIFRGLFASLFPSAIVQRYVSSDEYPTSKILIKELKVQIRMQNIVCPIICVELRGVTMEVEKAYLAPRPPPEFVADAQDSLPSAIPPSDDIGPEIPIFDDRIVLDFLRGDELRDADTVTFWMERWSECTYCF